MNKRNKAIFFDLDNTLYEYQPCNEAGKNAVFNFLSKRLGKKTRQISSVYSKSRNKVHKDLTNLAASHSRLFYIQKTVEEITGQTDVNLILQAHNLFWKSYFNKMKLRPGVLGLLKKIKSKKIKLVIISDLSGEIQMQKIKKLGLSKIIDLLVTSEEVGVEKPDPKMVHRALQKTKLNKDQVLIIGDSESRDKAVAKKAKIEYQELSANNQVKKIIKLFS